MYPKLNSTVSVVKISDTILEFFKTNSRQQVHIKVKDDTILNIVLNLDGNKSTEEISKEFGVKLSDLESLIKYLKKKGIIDNVDPKLDFDNYECFRRTIHFLSEYSNSHEHLLEMWKRIQTRTVLIVGLGAVGSWVACNLIQSGVLNLIIIDPDMVEISNLPRQFSYVEEDVGKYKVDVIERKLKEYNSKINIQKYKIYLNETSLHVLDNQPIDLIINCADKPTVDLTSLWVGEYAMMRNIPHIVGGGYNLHLSLIGQTVIPGQTACVNCFRKTLEEENKIDTKRVKKLVVKNRKIGSFGPMCSIIASMIGMEAIKILTGEIEPSNCNRRGEFDIYSMNIKYKYYARRDDCEWCGKKGKYCSL